VTYQDLFRQTEAAQRKLMQACEPGREVKLPERETRSSEIVVDIGYRSLPHFQGERLSLPTGKAIVVGIDVREWTRRSWPAQMVITSILNTCILKSRKVLRDAGVLARDEPLIAVPTGDGAHLVFIDKKEIGRRSEQWTADGDGDAEGRTKQYPAVPGAGEKGSNGDAGGRREQRRLDKDLLGRVLSFVFILNTLVTEYNHRRLSGGSQEEDPEDAGKLRILPIYPRFCLTWDDVLLCIDLNDRLNAVGRGMVTCARILASDHGNHFLVHTGLLHEAQKSGGLARIAKVSPVGDWDARLHITELPEQQVKSGSFRYADVFGHYSDAPLLRLLRSPSVTPQIFHIGSHDVQQVRGSKG